MENRTSILHLAEAGVTKMKTEGHDGPGLLT